jgi:hypothetical protein
LKNWTKINKEEEKKKKKEEVEGGGRPPLLPKHPTRSARLEKSTLL